MKFPLGIFIKLRQTLESVHDGWKSLKEMTSLSKLKGVTVHMLQLFRGMQDVSQEEPCSNLLSTTAKQVCVCAWERQDYMLSLSHTWYFLPEQRSTSFKTLWLFFTASVFARKLFSGVRFRSCCQSIIGADYLISFHLLWLWNSLRAAYVMDTHSVSCVD